MRRPAWADRALVFDHPSLSELSDHLLVRVAVEAERERSSSLLNELDRLETLLGRGADGDDTTRSVVAKRLRGFLAGWEGTERAADGADTASGNGAGDADIIEGIEAASTSEIFDFIDNELGRDAT